MIEGMDVPSISVVIPTHGRPELLRRCLDAVLVQAYPPDCVEIVVVEDGGPGDAAPVVRELQGRPAAPRLRYRAVRQGGPGAARNAGLAHAQGDVIAFTDDDTVPDRRWLAAGVAALSNGADAVSGRTIVPLSDQPTDAEANVQGLERATFATCNVLVKRQWLDRVGGFDPRFRRAYREDSDLEFRLLDAGARIARVDDAIVVHPPRPEPPFASLRQQRNQVYDALLFKKHPTRFRATIRKRPPSIYYAITLGQIGAILAVARQRPRLALLTNALWVTLVGRFFLQRVRHRSRSPEHVAELAVTSALIPPLAVYWRLRGAWAFRVAFF
jgi:GT2 family glycosyltransferase